MKTVKRPSYYFLLLFLVLISCKTKHIDTQKSDLPKCSLTSESAFLNSMDKATIINGKGSVEFHENEAISAYYIKHPGVPTGYLAVCNLPDEFNADGVQVIFSGTVYISKFIDYININAVPFELTAIQRVDLN
jgi:hypothetical protein